MAASCFDCWKDDREIVVATHEDDDDPVCYAHKVARCKQRGEDPPPRDASTLSQPPKDLVRTPTSTVSAPTPAMRTDARASTGPANSAAGPATRPPRSSSSSGTSAVQSVTARQDADPGASVHAPGEHKPARKERREVEAKPTICSRGCGRPTHRGACSGQGKPKTAVGKRRPHSLRELKPEEFNSLFRPRIGHDEWTDKVLNAIEQLPMKKFYAVDIPKERSVQGFQNTLQRYFKGRSFKLRKFRGKGPNRHLMGIFKEPSEARA